MSKRKVGEVIIPAKTNVWPHELATAKSLAAVGHIVKFQVKIEKHKTHSADALLDEELWEFKAPNGGTLASVERNLRRGKSQSHKIVFDSRRMKHIPDSAIVREIKSKAPHIKGVERVIFVNRHGKCIDIYPEQE